MTDKSLIEFNGWLPNGLRIFYKVTFEDLSQMIQVAGRIDGIVALTNAMLAAGMALEDPTKQTLEAGHHREQVSGILRRNFLDEDGTIVPVIDIYPDNPVLGRRCVFKYLDEQSQIDEFEAATGIKLSTMPVYPETQLNRVEKPKLAEQYIVPVKTTVSVVFKDNPAYDENASKKKAKHLFVRWETAQPVGNPTTPTPPAQPAASEPDYAAIEKAEREKAAKALDNEAVTIIEWRYEPNHNGQGVPRWNAKATVADGATIPVALYSEHMTALKKAGFPTPNDAGNLAIDVITVKNGTERRISAILTPDGKTIPVTQENALNAHFNADNPPAWIFDFTKLMYALRDLTSVSGQEKANTVNKMHADNEFEKVSSLDAAALMVRNRLAVHRQQKAG